MVVKQNMENAPVAQLIQAFPGVDTEDAVNTSVYNGTLLGLSTAYFYRPSAHLQTLPVFPFEPVIW